MLVVDASMPAALAALVAVTACEESVARSDRSFGELLDAVRAAADVPSALLLIDLARDGTASAMTAAGATPEEARVLGPAVAGLSWEERSEVEAAAGDGGPLGEALAQVGRQAALVLPVPVGDGEAHAGVLVLSGPAIPEDPLRRHAIRVGAARLGSLLERVRLRENLERAMAQILATDERMLGRIGLDIHDGPTQQLSVALLEVQLLEAELDEAEQPLPDALRPALSRIYETVGGALHEMRELIGHLRPGQFEDRRLDDLLRDLISSFEARTDCRVEAAWEGEFPVNGVSITQRITLFRILQETLNNAHRHGRCGRAWVTVTEDESGTSLEVRDDGRGFDVEQVERRRATAPLARFGLLGMRDRAQILGGTFEIESVKGEGTTVRVFLPQWRGTGAGIVVDGE